MAEDLLKTLIKKRGIIKGKITLFSNKVAKIKESYENKQDISEQNVIELEERINQISDISNEFDNVQSQIEMEILDDESKFTEQLAQREQIFQTFYDAFSLAKYLLNQLKPPINNDQNSVHSDRCSSKNDCNSPAVKLPDIKLPSFSGSSDTWLEFRDTFTALINDNPDIDDINKFHYLRASLEGSARQVIQSLEISARTYTIAWELLCKRYNNKKLLIHNHLDALFNLEKIGKASSFKLRNLSDTVAKHLRALSILQLPTDQWDILILHLMAKSLDDVSVSKWEEFKSKKDLPSLEDMYEFLRSRADLLERLELNKLDQGHKSGKTRGLLSADARNDSQQNKTFSQRFKCAICSGEHRVFLCEKFKALSVLDRSEQAKRLKLCLNCLRGGHKTNQCRLYASCKTCRGKHNTLLHIDNKNQNVSLTASSEQFQILLSTAVVDVLDGSGSYVPVRAILDSGSMSSFITESLYSKLNIPKQTIQFAVSGLNSAVSNINSKCHLKIKSQHNNFITDLSCFVLPEITGNLPTFSINKQNLMIPKDLILADKDFNNPGPVEMLIGADIFWNVLCPKQLKLTENGPVLQETQLGWLVSGKIHGIQISNNTFCSFVKNESYLSIQDQLSNFFEIESVKTASPWSKEEMDCETYFMDTTTRTQEGRFVVSIPLKQSTEMLGDSLGSAKKRFKFLEQKFTKNDQFSKMYKEFVLEYEYLGHMQNIGIVSNVNHDGAYYLPHHGILRMHSSTTKLRTVFDASARISSGVSFNELQLKGPVIQDDLVAILLRFRQYKYVVTADIEKMYRQVLVSKDQHKLQRILWRENENKDLNVFELSTVTYGTTSAPFLAIRCLVELGKLCKDKLPIISNIILHDFYVDDLLTGFDDIHVAKECCLQLCEVLRSGCFPLRKWRSNFPEILKDLEDCKFAEASEGLVIGEDDVAKTLGIIWMSKTDKLIFHIDVEQNNESLTKRVMLSCISRIFDPMGLLGPCIIIAKVMLQQLWKENLSWDSPVSYELQVKWNNFIQELPSLNNLKIERHVICDNPTRIDLHAFSDASEVAYGAAIYIRSENCNGEIFCNLLISKAKVAPIKSLTVPRLELCAAHVLAKLVNKVTASLRLNLNSLIFWSDSTIVLVWIKTSVHLLKPFVRNRIAEIQDLTDITSWRYVPSLENPADILSRGSYPSSLNNSNIWWHGPHWLKESPELWPKDNSMSVPLPEIKTSLIAVSDFKFPFEQFSSLIRLKRCMALILRFIKNCLSAKENRTVGALTANELDTSLKLLIKLSQISSFNNEYNDLTLGSEIDKKSKLLSLNPFIDSDGILRVGGRLENSKFHFNKKHPMILSSKHYFTKLLFEQEHKNLLHAGPSQLLYNIRETYWPIAARNLAKSVVHKCIQCYRLKPKTVQPIMGNLPSDRLLSGFPFQIAGVDYAGPFFVLNKKGRGSKLLKGYVCLFICFATKAVHMEFVNSLSTEDFLLALKRFISRRGKPCQIYSDHGTNFIGANRNLKELYDFLNKNEESISDFVNNQGISWNFNPVQAPHFGGLWEAGVKAMKYNLKRVSGNSNFTVEEFTTLLCQVEAILNSRPLSPLSTNPLDPSPLTPTHFIIGRPLTSILEPDMSLEKESRLSRYQKIENARQHFWTRWYKEYVSELQQRVKWKTSNGKLEEGMLVLVKDDKLPPLNWKLGRVTNLIYGSDNISRVAEILTNNGPIKRDFSKICPLPLDN